MTDRTYDLGPRTIELIHEFVACNGVGVAQQEQFRHELREIAVAAHCHATRLAFTEVETAIKRWQR